MRKIMFMLAFVCTMTASAQFVATKNGIVSTDSCGYFVESFNGADSAMLYQEVKKYFANETKNMKILDDVQNNKLSVLVSYESAFESKRISNLALSYALYMDVDLVYTIYFKNGRLRYDAPIIKSMGERVSGLRNAALWRVYLYEENRDKKLTFNIFKEDGSIVRKEKLTYDNLNKWINDNIKSISDYIRKPKTEISNW